MNLCNKDVKHTQNLVHEKVNTKVCCMEAYIRVGQEQIKMMNKK